LPCRAIFFIDVPLGALAVLFTLRHIAATTR